MPLTVAVVDDDHRYRSLIAHALMAAEGLTFVGAAYDVASGMALIEAKKPQVLLVDLGLPTGSGLDLIRHAVRHVPDCDIMVISVFEDAEHVLAAIAAGATGYLLKGTGNAELASQIRALHAGGSPISPVIARQLIKRLPTNSEQSPGLEEGPDDSRTVRLSDREKSVLQLSARGHTYEEIGRMIGVSGHTVLTYVKRTYKKLQVHNKVEAIALAQRTGIIER